MSFLNNFSDLSGLLFGVLALLSELFLELLGDLIALFLGLVTVLDSLLLALEGHPEFGETELFLQPGEEVSGLLVEESVKDIGESLLVVLVSLDDSNNIFLNFINRDITFERIVFRSKSAFDSFGNSVHIDDLASGKTSNLVCDGGLA